MVGLLLPLLAVRDLAFPLYWWALPAGSSSTSIGVGVAESWTDALVSGLLGLGWVAVMVGLAPAMARAQARPGGRLLSSTADVDLSSRVAQLTATRAGALEAHAVELALGELRAVVRGILPPVLADPGLAGALTGLAATSPVPCHLDVDVPGQCAASVEATAYFVVAESLTNVAKHAHAHRAEVAVRRCGERLQVRVADDGRGGADQARGSGLAGVRRRVEAHDGVLTVSSPLGGPTTVAVELPCGS